MKMFLKKILLGGKIMGKQEIVVAVAEKAGLTKADRSEEHTSELQSL